MKEEATFKVIDSPMTDKDNTRPHYLSDQFTEASFASMTTDSMYAIYSAPDTGKTTLITDVLQPYLKRTGKKALYLTSRLAILEQLKGNVDNSVMTCWTYQKIEDYVDKCRPFVTTYDFIVCDEAHYFIEDAELTKRTDLSFNFINNSNAVIILMSGTPDYIECLRDSLSRPISVLMPLDTSVHNVDTICLVPAANKKNGDEDDIKEHLEQLVKLGKRIVVYDSNITDLYQLYAQYEVRQGELGINVSFLCSQHNKTYYPKSDEDDLRILMDTQRIYADMLFITSALNTGVSIDEDFEYMFILGCPSRTAMFQLIARIRRGHNNRSIKTIYCSVPPYQTLRTRRDSRLEDLMYVENPIEWKSKRRQLPCYVYQNKKSEFDHNHLIISKIRQDVKEYDSYLYSGKPLDNYREMFRNRYVGAKVVSLFTSLLVDLLDNYNNLPYLDKEEQDTIKELCRRYNINSSIGKINEQLRLYDIPIQLMSHQKKTKGLKKQVWYIKQYENLTFSNIENT